MDSTLSAFSFQHWDPRTGAALSFPGPPVYHPTPRDAVLTTAPGARAFGFGAFSFLANHVIQPLSVLVSYFFFKVSCLPKITSLRLGDRGEIAADSDKSADFRCQVSSIEGTGVAGDGLRELRCVSPSCWCAVSLRTASSVLRVLMRPSPLHPVSPSVIVQDREVTRLLALVRPR